MNAWWSAQELADLQLDCLPKTKSGVIRLAKKEGWSSRQRKARGGGKEYAFTGLPEKIRSALLAHSVKNEPEPPAVEASPAEKALAVRKQNEARPVLDAAKLHDWQRQCMAARLAFVRQIDKMITQGAGKEEARHTLIQLAEAGQLPDGLQALVPVANARSGNLGKRTLSRRSLCRWESEARRGEGALAPRKREGVIPEWASPLMKLYCRPHKPPLKRLVERDLPNLLPEGVQPPSYDAAQRLLRKLSIIDKNRGRLGPHELKRLKVYRVRDVSELWPTDVYAADGHTFDAEVQHPIHGQAFRPEVTQIIDAHTHKIVGWSAGLAENTWGSLDALRDACEKNGIPAIYYTDRGSGFDNAAMTTEGHGLIDRLGAQHERALPYNSQGRGIIERPHQSTLIPAAKRLPTYMGADMDKEARNKIYKITRTEIKTVGVSATLPSWGDFLAVVQEEIDYYNDRPHRGNGKIVDPVSGKRRHMSPNEQWALAEADGFEAIHPEKELVDDIFRPYVMRATSRGMLQLFGNSYFHKDLEHYNTRETGEKVVVGYDIHDPSRVWVRETNGRLICIAQIDGNSSPFFPKSVLERAHEKRGQARKDRLERKLDEVEMELNGGQRVIEHQPIDDITRELANAELLAMEEAQAEEATILDFIPAQPPAEWEQATAMEPLQPLDEDSRAEAWAQDDRTPLQAEEEMPDPVARPVFATDLERWTWVEDHPEEATEEDRRYLAALIESDDDFRLMVEIEEDRRKKKAERLTA